MLCVYLNHFQDLIWIGCLIFVTQRCKVEVGIEYLFMCLIRKNYPILINNFW
jgi:hypothetical protein